MAGNSPIDADDEFDIDENSSYDPLSASEENRSPLIRERHKARQVALQVLYEIDTTNHQPGKVLDARQSTARLGPDGLAFLRWLISGVISNREDVDQLIGRYAPEWPVPQLAVIDRNILRLAIFELISPDSDAPSRVVINEAVELAKSFGSDSTPRFINGVLGTAMAEFSSST